jgi:hypothetical protein
MTEHVCALLSSIISGSPMPSRADEELRNLQGNFNGILQLRFRSVQDDETCRAGILSER